MARSAEGTQRGKGQEEEGTLPTPERLGLPGKFEEWRRGQEQAIWDLSGSDKRFDALVAPTGSGKSLTYVAYAAVLSEAERVCIIVSTKAQQDQLMRDFGDLEGMVDVRGQTNYLCLAEEDGKTTVEDGPCHTGTVCALKQNGCLYYDRVRDARSARIVVTNYSFWLATNAYSEGIGDFDILVMDEAHAAPGELSAFLSLTIHERDARELIGMELPGEGQWWNWAGVAHEVCERKKLFLSNCQRGDKATVRKVKKLKTLSTKLHMLLDLGTKIWTPERQKHSMRWDVTNPGPLAERFLFQETEKSVLSSATVRPKTLELLGVEEEEKNFFEYPSSFPPERRPIWVLQKDTEGRRIPRLNYRTSREERDGWHSTINRIIGERLDRRGIVHTVSYSRAREIYDNSEHAHFMVLHDPGSESLMKAVEEYLGKKPAVLVTPAATTGLDFPYDACEYQVIAKIPYPDMRSKVLRARMKVDQDYPSYLAMQTLVQSCGRGMRAEDDQCETFLVDGNAGWFLSRYARFSPRWWRKAIRKTTGIPKPMMALNGRC
jgi:Rad3-related DNA helicase